MSRERINVSLTEQGLEILDREREGMGLSRSAMFEVLLRFWIRDQKPLSQGHSALGVDSERERSERKGE